MSKRFRLFMFKLFLLFLLILLVIKQANGQEQKRIIKVYAVKTSSPISIDGKLTEPVWRDQKGVSNFLQRDPKEGEKATETTVVKVAYDQSAIYIGARMYDNHPDSIVARLARKDYQVNTDQFTVFLDPYHDLRTGFYFSLSAAGTFYDGVLYNNDFQDDSWDGVWDGKVNIDSLGWTAEFKIPFSQLRFTKGDTVWGINFERVIARNNETDYLVYTPKNASGFVSRFCSLYGLSNLNPPNNIEVLPYVTAKGAYTLPDANNPFNRNGQEYTPGLGADLKASLSSNLKLNLTINPDFGQVEIDPAVINLTDVETFFTEKRPFFVEGSSVFNFGIGGSANYYNYNWPDPTFFYSRRIGRTPEGGLPPYDYADYPDGTHIISAAKLTGKLGSDLSIGAVSALTSRESADISFMNQKSTVEVEPLTYYGVFRAQNEFNEGAQGLGIISTITNRFFNDKNLKNELDHDAYIGGIDGWSFLDDSKTWVISGWGGLSYVGGTKQRITELQEDPVHYFQRPDSKYLTVDTNATSMLGYAGRISINKQKGNVYFNSAIGFISPKFEVNDLGYLTNSNVINMHIIGGYRWTVPKGFYRLMDVTGVFVRNYNYDGNITYQAFLPYGEIQFSNYYLFDWGLGLIFPSANDRLTRGGPLTQTPLAYKYDFYLESDTRKKWDASFEIFYQDDQFSNDLGIAPSIEFKPAANVSLSISPTYELDNNFSQYLNTYDDPTETATFGKRYVFGELNQKTLGASISLNWTFTPNLSLQFFAQPLISIGKFSNLKELEKPDSYNFLVYGENGSTFDKTTYTADPDGPGPAAPIEIGNPNFDYISLRGDAVLRWEYLPGSVIYFVWTQNRFYNSYDEMFDLNQSASRIFDLHPDNIFLIKFTYWFSF
jgi:Domain of unknown function (DUF5916)/Carbohydrate family 9 binding domain-like